MTDLTTLQQKCEKVFR